MYTPHAVGTTSTQVLADVRGAGGNTSWGQAQDDNVQTQVLRLLIPLGVQQSKLLLSWIQVTSYYNYTTMLSQENFPANLGIRSVYVHMHMC